MSRAATFLLNVLLSQRKIMSELTDLQAAVAKNTATIATAVAQRAADQKTIADQAAQIIALQAQVTDAAALTALTTQLTNDDATLDAALAPAQPAA